jgi:RNA polymerase sigma-70 factor (ECF subfamily)
MNPTSAPRATVKSPAADAEDRALAARLARGEPGAFDELVDRYGRRVTALASRLLGWSRGADDVAQDVFLATLEKRAKFRGEARLWTYLAAITVNRCRSVLRRRWLQERVLAVLAPARPVAREGDCPTGADETGRVVRAAVARLPTAYREVIVLRYLEELSIDEVAAVLALTRGAVEQRLSRARRLLAEPLAHLVDDD